VAIDYDVREEGKNMFDIDIKYCKNNCGVRTAHPDGICQNCKKREIVKALNQCRKGFVN